MLGVFRLDGLLGSLPIQTFLQFCGSMMIMMIITSADQLAHCLAQKKYLNTEPHVAQEQRVHPLNTKPEPTCKLCILGLNLWKVSG